MNSSISTSEPRAWRRYLFRYAAISCLGTVLAAAIQIAIDPYDSRRFALFGEYGVPPFGQRLTAASLARQPDVEGAILGNSTIQGLDPARLTQLNGFRFVSLALAATGPLEQLAVGRWLVRHHDGKSGRLLRALVLGVDTRWCRGDGTIELTNPFPFWLYSDSQWDYVFNLPRLGAFGAVGQKIRLMLGLKPPLGNDGYRDYDSEWPWNTEADLQQGLLRYELFGTNFAGVNHLRDFLPVVPLQTIVVLLFPPRYHGSLPAPGTKHAAEYEACKAAYRAIAAGRPRTVVLDFLKDDPLLRIASNFLDRAHYLRPVAEMVEDAIAARLHSNAELAGIAAQ